MSAFKERREAALASVQIRPIMVDRHTAAAMLLGLSLPSFEKAVRQGLLPQPRMIGHRVGWLVSELEKAAAALPVSNLLPPPQNA